MHTESNADRFSPDETIFAYLKGSLDEESKKSFLEWLDLDPANLKYYTEIKAVYNHLHMRRFLTLRHFKAELRRLNATIDSARPWYRRNLRAAVFSLATSLSALLLLGGALCYFSETDMVTYDTSDGRTMEIELEDGTHVWLKGHSQLSYDPESYDKDRSLNLKGEAVFDVVSNPANPFIVSAPAIKVKVHGTVFHISSFLEDGPAETVLAEGLVSLYDSKGDYLVTLSPSQKAVYNSGMLQVKEVKVDDMAMLRYGLHIIRDASLQEIVRTLERDFNVRLRAVSYASTTNLFTISYIKDAKIDDVLELLETISGSKFEIDD